MSAASDRTVALEVRDLVARRGSGSEAFELRIDALRLHAGETLVVMGPNGSGKTTLLYALAGLGRNADAAFVRRPTGPVTLVFQRPAAFSGSVTHNVSAALLGADVSRRDRERRVEAALARFGIQGLADHDAHHLSGGELRRLALARALVLEPEVLLLDEPFDDLDGEGQRRLTLDLQRAVSETGVALAVVTHDLRRGLMIADQIAVLGRGRIAQSGAREEILLHPQTPEVARTVGMTNLARGRVSLTSSGDLAVEVAGNLAFPIGPGSAEQGQTVRIGIRPEHLQIDVGRAGGVSIGSADITAIVDDGLVQIVTLTAADVELTTHLLAGRGPARTLSPGDSVSLAARPEHVHVMSIEDVGLAQDLGAHAATD